MISSGSPLNQATARYVPTERKREENWGQNIRITRTVPQQHPAPIPLPCKRYKAVFTAGIELVVGNGVGLRAAIEVEGAVVGGLDGEADAIDGDAVGLAGVELGQLPDVVALFNDGASVAGGGGRRSGKAGSGGEDERSGDCGKVHDDEAVGWLTW